MRYQSLPYAILPDGGYTVLQSPAASQIQTEVVAFGVALMFMGFVVGMVRSLVIDSLLPEKDTPELLLQSLPRKESNNDVKMRKGHPVFSNLKVSQLLEKWRTAKVRNSSLALRDLETLGADYDTQNCRNALEDYRSIERADFSDPEEYQEARDEAWENFIESLESLAGEEEENETISHLPQTGACRDYRMRRNPVGKETLIANAALTSAAFNGNPETEPKQLESRLSKLLKEGSAMVVPPAWHWLLADNRRLIELDWLPTTETTEHKVEGILKQLKAGVESIQQSDQFRLFLSTMGKFHDYSIGNMILIMLQKPQATHVAGFNTWKELGRYVKAGEKGIAILAPVMPPRPTCANCGAKLPRNSKYCPRCGSEVDLGEELAATPRYFRVVYVFDLSQTEGKPLPEFEVPALSGEANEALFSRVLDLARKQGLTVSFESKPEQDPEIKGFYFGKSIWVRPEESRAQQLKTLLHEMAHYYTEGVMGISRKDAETIAESAAFAIGARFGFDSGVRSFPYVALWSQDKKVLEENLAAIRKVTGKMIEGLEQLSLKGGGAA